VPTRPLSASSIGALVGSQQGFKPCIVDTNSRGRTTSSTWAYLEQHPGDVFTGSKWRVRARCTLPGPTYDPATSAGTVVHQYRIFTPGDRENPVNPIICSSQARSCSPYTCEVHRAYSGHSSNSRLRPSCTLCSVGVVSSPRSPAFLGQLTVRSLLPFHADPFGLVLSCSIHPLNVLFLRVTACNTGVQLGG